MLGQNVIFYILRYEISCLEINLRLVLCLRLIS